MEGGWWRVDGGISTPHPFKGRGGRRPGRGDAAAVAAVGKLQTPPLSHTEEKWVHAVQGIFLHFTLNFSLDPTSE